MSLYLVAYDIDEDNENNSSRQQFDIYLRNLQKRYDKQRVVDTTFIINYPGDADELCSIMKEAFDHILEDLYSKKSRVSMYTTHLRLCVVRIPNTNGFAHIGLEDSGLTKFLLGQWKS